MKRIALVILAALLTVCLWACTATPVEPDPTEAPTNASTETPTEAPTEAPTEEPTEAPTEEPTEAPTEEPTEAPTQAPTNPPVQPTNPPVQPTNPPVQPTNPPVQPTNPPVQPTNPPVQPTNPPVQPTDPPAQPTDPPAQPTDPPAQPTDPPAEPEEDATVYTGRLDGREVNIILSESGSYFVAVESDELSEEDAAEMGLNGTVRANMLRKVAFESCSVNDNVIALSGVGNGYYVSAEFEGTAAEAFVAMYLESAEQAKEAGQISQEEYDLYKALFGGEEIFVEEDQGDVSITAKVNDDKLITELTLEEPEYQTYIYKIEYNNGVATKETCFVPDALYEVPHATVITYYADGVTVKTDEFYTIKEDGDSWALDTLKRVWEYREDGTTLTETYYWEDSTRVTEYNEEGVREKETTYDENNEIISYTECYDDGSTKKHVRYNEDGTEDVEEYYENGNTKYELTHYGDGSWREYEYYENGQTKREVSCDTDGFETVNEYYEDGTQKLETRFYDDGVRAYGIVEYNENGKVTCATVYLVDGGWYIVDCNEAGETVKITYYDDTGAVTEIENYAYTYYDDNSIKSIILTDGDGVFIEKIEYEYHENGNYKKQVYASADGYQEILECYEDGTVKFLAWYEADGSYSEREHYENGKLKTDYYYESEGNWYRYEYYEDGTVKSYTREEVDGSSYTYENYEDGSLKYEKYPSTSGFETKEYSENGEVVKKQHLDQNGNAIRTWYYEYYADGNCKKVSMYNYDALHMTQEYTYYANGNTATFVQRYADGSYFTYDFYESGYGKKYVEYDSEGEVVFEEVHEESEQIDWGF